MSHTSKYDGVIDADTAFHLPSHMNYGAYVLEKLSAYGDKIAFVNGATDEKLTFNETVQEIVNVASSLTKFGLKRGEVVAICSENRPEYFISSVAALCSGAVLTFINNAYSKGELIHTLGISKPKYILMSPSSYDAFYNVMKDNSTITKYIVFGKQDGRNAMSYQDLVTSYVDKHSYKPVDYKGHVGIGLILYSSGTTGPPKGAKLKHSSLIMSGMQPSVNHLGLNVLSIAPWSNTIGYIVTIREVMYGNTCIYLNKFKESDYLRAIQEYSAGYLLVVPPLVVMLSKSSILSKYDVSSVQHMYCGGAPMDWSVIAEAKKRFPNLKHIFQGYGMTELTGVVTEESEGNVKNGSVGKVVIGNIIKIVDIETRKILGPNIPGEVCVKGPVLFDGYVGKDMSEYLDEEGFYKTGDVAYYDEEGFYFITDRLKELIKYKAWQVAPAELEAIILQHPAVKDAGVIGVPDQLAGEIPAAFVVKKPSGKVTEREIVEFVASKVSPWKQLRGGVRFVEEIPKNGSGKILRRVLRDMLKKLQKSKI